MRCQSKDQALAAATSLARFSLDMLSTLKPLLFTDRKSPGAMAPKSLSKDSRQLKELKASEDVLSLLCLAPDVSCQSSRSCRKEVMQVPL